MRRNSQKRLRKKLTKKVRMKLFSVKVIIHKGFSRKLFLAYSGTVIVIIYSNRDKERKTKNIKE